MRLAAVLVLVLAFACSGVIVLAEPPVPKDDGSPTMGTTTTPNPYVKEGSVGAATKPACPKYATEYRPLNCWLNERFIFLPQPKSLQEFGYQSITGGNGQFGHPTYSEAVGRIAKIVGIEKGKYTGWDVTLKVEGSERTYVGRVLSDRPDDASLHSLGPVADLDQARDLWNGKTVWVKWDYFHHPKLWTYNADSGEIGELPIERCSKLMVTDVVAGWYEHEPVRLVLTTADGKTGFVDVQLSGTNVPKLLRNDESSFDRMFFVQDPHEIYSWPDAVWEAIATGQVFIGMSAEQARLSWGRPKGVHTTMVEGQKSEQWVYHSGRYVYVTGGKVSGIQN